MVELYIDGKKADLTTTVSVPMNYELEKLENPTIIKNNFSKTISLEATPANNDIFSYYYDLTKVHTGFGFCANKRIPFELFRDSDLVETGYLQLNNIKYKNNKYTYEITLYGGLGDFLYNLAYDDEGNEKTLADLNYGYGENDERFEFKMNADTVVSAWDNIEETELETPLGETINFIPSYNGLYEDFDNDKVLINTNGQTIFPKTQTIDDKTYSTIDGYGLAELNEEMTEWEIRDLRCYKQRPAFRLKKFIEAVCKPENNGGYTVELDKKYFFNDDNKYYEDAWIALPILNPDSEEFPVSETELETNIANTLSINDYKIEVNSTPITFSETSLEEMNRAGGSATVDISVDFSLRVMVDGLEPEVNYLKLSGYNKIVNNYTYWSGIGVWIDVTDASGNVINTSDCYVFSNYVNGKYPSINDFNNFGIYPKTNYIYIDGEFQRHPLLTDVFAFYDSINKTNTFRVELKDVINYNNLKYTLKTVRWFGKAYQGGMSGDYGYRCYWWGDKITNVDDVDVIGIAPHKSVLNINDNKKTLQDTTITKNTLLKNKITPSSLLLSYTKLFGLYFVKDAQRKNIKLVTRNTFFENAEIIDIDDKIDYSNEVKIQPLMFDKKWYTLKCPALETTKMKAYKSDYYEAEYGQKRINTNYNFNSDEEDIYQNNQYQNVITMLDSSKYYKNFYSKGSRVDEYVNAPTFGLYGCNYKLWENYDTESVGEKSLMKYDIITKEKKPVQFGTLVGQDVFSKICCFDLDNDKQSLNDLSVTLLFYNGEVYTNDSEFRPVYYTISNDLPIMSTINEGTPMYLWSNSTKNTSGYQICHRRYVLPQFTRYDIQTNNVLNSFDFGLPYETYITENYTEDSTLYNKYWKNFYLDQFSENTRKVTAYVRFEDIMLGNHSLSNFYYFNNCYWLLNKIVDYDIANPTRKVKCEFIKINNTDNYTNGQTVIKPFYNIETQLENLEDYTIIENNLTYGGTYKVRFKTKYGIQYLELTMRNTTEEERNEKLKVEDEGNGYYTVTVSDIVGDTYIFIAGYYEKTISINYGLKSGVTIPDSASNKTLQLTGGDKSAIIWGNVLDDSDTMEITIPKYADLYYRLIPNAYGSDNRLRLGLSITKYYTDGTTESFTSSISTDSWSSLNINTNKVLQSIQLSVYDATVL